MGLMPAGAHVRWVTGSAVAGTLALLVSLVGPAAPATAADPNTPPVAVEDIAAMVAGQTITVSPLANDSDPDGDPLSLVSVAVTDPAAGSVLAVGNDVQVAAAATFAGRLQATYVVSDGVATTPGTIWVDVSPPPNAAPVAVDDAATMLAGAELRIDPRGNDSDPDGGPVSVTGATLATPGAGTVALEGQTVVIRAARGYAGPLVAAYTIVDDRGATASARILVTVQRPAANRAPVAVADTATVKAGRTYRITVLANDTDPDGDRIRLDRVKKAAKVSAKKSGSKVRFRAPKSFSGSVTIRYRIKDSHGKRDWGTLTVTVLGKPKPAAATSRNAVERALAGLGLPVGAVNGRYDASTRRAVCAWRTIVGRKAHRGLPSKAESRAIVAMTGLPAARSTMVTGLTVSVTCQAAFWVGADRSYRRVMAATTGKAGYRTRLGTFRVFRLYTTWRFSTIYPEARMYKPMQFSGGQAVHGSATDYLVKTYPASHGCVRMLHRDIDALQAGGFGLGSPVRVIGRW